MKKIILADQKLNQLVDDITSSLIQQYEFENGAISGAAITDFCPHSQVNQFILFRIYQDWNAQISQLVHPYFDYSAQEVKDGLRRFLNLLSSHIRIQQADFEPLVRQAVYNSIKLILNAEDAIGRFFFLNTDAIGIENYRKHAPYFSSFDFVIQAILKFHEKNELQQVEKKLFFEKFARVVDLWESKEEKSISEYQRGLFRDLTGKDLEDVIAKEQAIAEVSIAEENPQVTQQPMVEVEAEEKRKAVIRVNPETMQRLEERRDEKPQQELRSNSPTTPPWVETPKKEEKYPHERESKATVPPWVKEEVQDNSKQTILNSGREDLTTREKLEENKPRSLHESLAHRDGKGPSIVERGMEKKESGQNPKIEVRIRSNEPPKEEMRSETEKNPNTVQNQIPRSLIGSNERSDEFQAKEARTIAEKLRQQSNPVVGDEDGVRTIKAEHIPVHKQFQYVQKVFGGSSVKFKVVLDKINKTESLDETNEVLDKYVFNDPNVNRNDKVSKEFEILVRSRFNG